MTFDDTLNYLRAAFGRTVSIAIGNGDRRIAGFVGVLVGEEIPPDGLNMPGARAFRIVPEGVSRDDGGHHSVVLLDREQFESADPQDPNMLRIDQAGFRITVAVVG